MVRRRFGASTAALLVVASMIGSGVFTTTGLLLQDLSTPLVVLLVWLVGGVLALCGAMAYAELGAALPENGGEYRLLGRIYHPALGFVAGWVSFVAGFSAPMAAAALAFGEYLENLWAVRPVAAALGLLVVSSLAHGMRVRLGELVQNGATVLTLLLGVGLTVGGLVLGDWTVWNMNIAGAWDEVASPDFAVGLVFVAFSYSGYNAAIYVAGEVREPERRMSPSLVAGTGAVLLLYVGINAALLMAAPPEKLRGIIDLVDVAGAELFGPQLASLLSGMIALALLTTVSALAMSGPRVYEAMGRDYPRLRILAQGRSASGGRGPVGALVVQTLVAALMVITATFQQLLTYMGVMLSAFALVTIVGVVVLRRREPSLPRPYRVPVYPMPVILAGLLGVWMLVWTVVGRPVESLAGVVTALLGFLLYLWARRRGASPSRSPP